MSGSKLKFYYENQLKQIKLKKCGYLTKIKMMQGLMDRLKILNANPQLIPTQQLVKQKIFTTPESKSMYNLNKPQFISQNQSTSYSFYSDSPSISGQNITVQYQEQIMQKRVIKFQINEQIQAVQDDLFQMEKVVQTKRTWNDQLAKQIQKRMKQIGSHKKVLKQDIFHYPAQSFKKSNKNQFDQQSMMNCTVSGASGFGFNNRKVSYVNNDTSINTSFNTTKQEILATHLNLQITSQQRKKAKSHYLNKSIGAVTGIFKNILK